MRVTGILDDPDDAAQLLRSLGWLAYATDSQGARAPPPDADPDVPELPFTSNHDSIAYELEPWEQARRQRLQQYAQLRDEVAGIVVYDGEWNEANWKPTEADAWPQSIRRNVGLMSGQGLTREAASLSWEQLREMSYDTRPESAP